MTHTHTHPCVCVCTCVVEHRLAMDKASELRVGFNHRSASVSFVVDEVAVGEGSLQVNRASPLRIILRILHTHLPLRVGF